MAQAVPVEAARMSENDRDQAREGRSAISKTLKILCLTFVSIVVLATAATAIASAILLERKTGFVVTDPGTLLLLGTALVGLGVGTRRLFFD